MTSTTGFWIFSTIAIVAAGLAIAACGGSDGSGPTGPSSQTATISITDTGVSPDTVYIAPGGRVRFTNNGSSNRQINSDPFPAHSGCPPINEVGLLTPGQSKETGALSFAGTCGFHDHLTEGNPTFSGLILVGTNDPGGAPPTGY